MIPAAPVLSAALQAEIAAEEERALSPEAFEARVQAPWTAHEAEEFDALVRWFRRRYSTAGERLAAIRHRMDQLRASRSG